MDYMLGSLNAAAACSAGQVIVNDGQGGTYCIASDVLAALTHPANTTQPPHTDRRISRIQGRITREQGRWAKRDSREADILHKQQAQLVKLGVTPPGTLPLPCPANTIMDTDGKCHGGGSVLVDPSCPPGYTVVGDKCRLDPQSGVHGMGNFPSSDTFNTLLCLAVGVGLGCMVIKCVDKTRRR